MSEWKLTQFGMESTELADKLAELLEPIVHCTDIEAGSAIAVAAIASRHGVMQESEVEAIVEAFMEDRMQMLMWSMVAKGLLKPFVENGELRFENTDKAKAIMEDSDG